MKIDRELVLHIGKLAHMELQDREVELFSKQLQSILEYMEQLNEVTQPAEPFAFSEFQPMLSRPDTTLPSLQVEEALQNAPERVKSFFKVPRIIP